MNDLLNKQFNCQEIYNNPDNFNDLLSVPGYLIYRIHKIDSEWNRDNYIGDTNEDLRWRFIDAYFSHFNHYDNNDKHKLYDAFHEYGLDNFTLEIIYLGQYEYSLEGDYIDKYDSYRNGYNMTESGKGCMPFGFYTKGRIIVNNGVRKAYIDSKDLDKYLSDGWIRGSLNDYLKGRVIVTDGTDNKMILPNELDEFLADNPDFHIGNKTKGSVAVNDGNATRFVKSEDAENLISTGNYNYGVANYNKPSKDHIRVNNGDNDRLIHKDKLDEFLINNPDYKLGSCYHYSRNSNKSVVNNGIENKFVLISELDDYLSAGWVKGWKSDTKCGFGKGRVRVTDGNNNRIILLSELDDFIRDNPDYHVGFTNKSNKSRHFVTNGIVNKRIESTKLDEFLINNPDFRKGRYIPPRNKNH